MRSRLAFKALGLSALVLGVIMATAAMAHAEAGANWMVKGANITTALLPELQIDEVESNRTGFSAFINGSFTEFFCKKAVLVGAKLELEGKITAGTKIKFSECVTKVKGNLFPECEPNAGGTQAGVINTRELKGLINKHKLMTGTVDTVIKLSPRTGSKFAEVELGELCSLAEKVSIFGTLALKDCQSELLVEKELHLVEEGPLTTLTAPDELAEHPAVLMGSMILELGGTHKTLKWSGLPG